MLCNSVGSEKSGKKGGELNEKDHFTNFQLVAVVDIILERACSRSERSRGERSADVAGYCHIKFPPLDEATLSWVQPELNRDAEKSIDFYGPCDYDPTGAAEVRMQRAILLRELFGDSSND